MKSPATLCLIACAVAACASSNDGGSGAPRGERVGQRASAILKGTVDDTQTSVVAIFVAKSADFPRGGFCTGALIAPNVVLTAQHCVSALENAGSALCEDSATAKAQRLKAAVAAKDVTVVGTKEAYDANNRPQNPATVSRVIVLPDSTGALYCGRDVALLQLATPMATLPYEPRLDGPPSVSDPFTAVGYGLDGTSGDGVRRIRHDLLVVGVGLSKDPLGRIEETEAEWMANEGPCDGDSGGPAIDKSGKIIGVVARGTDACTDQVFSRIDSHADWLRSSVREASEVAGLETPAWARSAAATADAGPDGSAPAAGPGGAVTTTTTGCVVGPSAGSSRWGAFLAGVALAGVLGRRRSRRRT